MIIFENSSPEVFELAKKPLAITGTLKGLNFLPSRVIAAQRPAFRKRMIDAIELGTKVGNFTVGSIVNVNVHESSRVSTAPRPVSAAAFPGTRV